MKFYQYEIIAKFKYRKDYLKYLNKIVGQKILFGQLCFTHSKNTIGISKLLSPDRYHSFLKNYIKNVEVKIIKRITVKEETVFNY